MAKNPSNTQVKVGWILDSALPETTFPLATTLNTSALDLSEAISWNDYEIGANDSADLDDRALTDLGNAVSRGAASYGATLSMFRDKNNTDTSSTYQQAFQAFRVELVLGWLVVRVNKLSSIAWTAGDTISLYKVIAASVTDDTEGEDSTKFTVSFLPQGALRVHTMVGGAGVISGVSTTIAKTIAGGPWQLFPVVASQSIMSRATYVSSDITKATVSGTGVVTPLATTVSATITTSYGSATAPIVSTLTLT